MSDIRNGEHRQQRNDCRDRQRDQRHSPFVQSTEGLWQFAIASHHVLNTHQTGDGRVDRRQQQQREDDCRNRREGGSYVVFGDDAQHVFFVSRVRIDAVFAQHRQRDCQHCHRENQIQHDDLDEYDPNRTTRGSLDRLDHDARHVGHGFHARDGQDDRRELRPPLNGRTGGGFEMDLWQRRSCRDGDNHTERDRE